MDPDPIQPISPKDPTESSTEVFQTRPLKSKATIRWKITDLSLIIEDKSWTALAITFEARGSLGRNYQWRVSLYSDADYLYGRAELISPIKYRIPYKIEFNITNFEIEHENDLFPREITSQDDPQPWKICSSRYLSQLKNEQDVLEISIHLQCFGSETTQGFQIHNFPY